MKENCAVDQTSHPLFAFSPDCIISVSMALFLQQQSPEHCVELTQSNKQAAKSKQAEPGHCLKAERQLQQMSSSK